MQDHQKFELNYTWNSTIEVHHFSSEMLVKKALSWGKKCLPAITLDFSNEVRKAQETDVTKVCGWEGVGVCSEVKQTPLKGDGLEQQPFGFI